MADGTLPNLVFTDEKKFDIQQIVNQQNNQVWASSSPTEGRIVPRRQNSQAAMVWAAVTETGRSPLLFTSSEVKLNYQRYIADILKGYLLSWTKKHFKEVPWSLQQDSAPSHASKITQFWIQRKILSLVSNELWPATRPDLSPLDFSIWSILETKACSSSHPTVEALKAKLAKEWVAVPQEIIRAATTSFSARWRAVQKYVALNK